MNTVKRAETDERRKQMNELIKVTFENDNPVVSARELHEFLQVNTEFRH